jgi:predicted peroxiredoxin
MNTHANHDRGVALLVWSADLSVPERLATPFVMAQAAVALDQAVEMVFTAQATQALLAASADQLIGFGPERRTLDSYLQEARELGVQLYACSQALHALGCAPVDLHPACHGLGGAVRFMERCADPLWRTLVF